MKIAPIRTLVGVSLVMLGLLAAASLQATTPAPDAKESEAKAIKVTYFFLPG